MLFPSSFLSLYETKEKIEKMLEKRNISVTTEDIINSNKHPLNVLEELLYLYPPCDLRIDPSRIFIGSPSSYNNEKDLLLLEDIIRSSEYVTIKKDLNNNILELSVNFINNLDEIERYNTVVEKHNSNWIKEGRPTKKFDPIHGEEYDIEDKYVKPVILEEDFFDLSDDITPDISYGPLSNSRPKINRKLLVKAVYKVTILNNGLFKLEYVVYNSSNDVLYYNSVTHKNLSHLVKRSIQEIWGYPEEKYKYMHELYGISYLLSGRKLSICKRDNVKPSLLENKICFEKDPSEFYKLETKAKIYNTSADIITVIFPIISIIVSIVCALWCFYTFTDETYYMESYKDSLPGLFLFLSELIVQPYSLIAIIHLTILLYIRKQVLNLKRKVSVIKIEKHLA